MRAGHCGPKTRRILERGIYCQEIDEEVLIAKVEVTLEKKLLNTLMELDAAVKAMPSANPKLDLLKLFARIEELEKQLAQYAIEKGPSSV